MITRNRQIPEPSSRFIRIECDSCSSADVVFTMSKSVINCKFCGNLLAEPTGGQARLYGRIDSILDELPHIIIKTVQKHPVKKSVRLLLDTMIVHQLISGESLSMFVDESFHVKSLVVLDRILIETKNMELYEYGVSLTIQDIVNRLEKLEPVEEIQLDWTSKEIGRAREIYESKEYVDKNGKELSETDCILLQMSLELDDIKLVTHDRTLVSALHTEELAASS